MKNLILFFLLLSNVIFGQDLIVQYKYEKQYSLKDTLKSTEYDYLKISGNKSIFFSEGEYKSDSIINNSKQKIDFKSLPDDKLGCIITKDLSKREIVFYSNDFLENDFKYSEYPNFKFEITQKKKNILGYDCTLAKTNYGGRDYNIYFTNQIPIQEGPYKFFGLPGLILQVYDVERKHSFTAVGITKNKAYIQLDISQRKFVETTRQKYFIVRKNYESNPMQRSFELMNNTQIYEKPDANGNMVNLIELNNRVQKSMIEQFKTQNKIEIKP